MEPIQYISFRESESEILLRFLFVCLFGWFGFSLSLRLLSASLCLFLTFDWQGCQATNTDV